MSTGDKGSKLTSTAQSNLQSSTSVLGRRAASTFGQDVTNELPGFQSPGAFQSTTPETGRPLLLPNNLFHPFSESPSPEIRKRAAFIKQHAYCPHPDHHQTRIPMNPDDPEARKSATGPLPPAHVKFECPDCGVPISCSEEHWVDDYESHLEICDTLREINEDDHDLRSGRFFPEFEFPDDHIEEAMVNMTNWDTLLFTRGFQAINEERSLRQATRLLTYPLTIGSILHELSPYNIKKGGRLTVEGLKSLNALRYTLHPPRNGAGPGIKGLKPRPPPVRIFILGARAESSLPRQVWVQLAHLFPRVTFHLIFIGPESMLNRDNEFPLPERTPSNPFGAVVEDRITNSLKISTYVEYYQTLHQAGQFYPYDPYFDCFMLFHPGLGHPASSHEWQETIPQLLETKVPILVTGYTQYDMERDIKWVKETVGNEMDMLMEPGENRFRSLRWDLNDLDPQDISCGNWGVWGFRGKRYETTRKDAENNFTTITSTMSLKTIYVTRHGFRSNWAVDPSTGIYSTTIPSPTNIPSDPALAGHGEEQAYELACHLLTLNPPIQCIYSSPFYRCIQTINPFAILLSPPLPIRGENGIGEWYGKAPFDHPSPASPALLHKLWPQYDINYTPVIKPSVNGESIEQLHDRAAYALHRIIEQSDRDGVQAIVLCTHAATLIAIGRILTGRMPDDIGEEDFRPFTCGLSRFTRREGKGEMGIKAWEGPEKEIPRVRWREGRGVGGGWDVDINGDCSFLSQGEQRGWRFSGDESFAPQDGSAPALDAGSGLGVVVEGKKTGPSRL